MEIIVILLLVGVAAGMLGGLVGVGGGIVIVPALVYFLGFGQHLAQGTSLAVIVMPVGILGVLTYYQKGQVDFKTAILIALGFVVGSFIGSKVAVALPVATLKKVFGVLLALIAAKMLFWDK